MAGRNQDKATGAFDRAIRLREAIYRVFSNQAWEKRVNPNDLAILNEALPQAMSHLQITPSSQGFDWEWTKVQDEFDQILWSVARSAGELLTSDNLDRVSECADDRGCGYLFVDMSRNRSRRWCSMEACGNRAKAARNYERLRIRK
jgi:predicted RNA-binding Zn ribbon-like protein